MITLLRNRKPHNCKNKGKIIIGGEYEFQVCLEDGMCIPGRPTSFEVSAEIKADRIFLQYRLVFRSLLIFY